MHSGHLLLEDQTILLHDLALLLASIGWNQEVAAGLSR